MSITDPDNNDQIQDAYNYYGYVAKTEELKKIGYKIVKIQSRTGDQHQGETIVINLRKLIETTFDTEWETPTPPPPNEFPQSRKNRRRK